MLLESSCLCMFFTKEKICSLRGQRGVQLVLSLEYLSLAGPNVQTTFRG